MHETVENIGITFLLVSSYESEVKTNHTASVCIDYDFVIVISQEISVELFFVKQINFPVIKSK